MASRAPIPLSNKTGLRATQTPQQYDRQAGEERRQIVQRYREQERRNQELREREAADIRANQDRKYETYKAESDRLRTAGDAQAKAAERYNEIRDRFNAASAEEQQRLEPELRQRADDYNQASKRLESQAQRYNASVIAAKNAGAIDRSAQTVNYKADSIKVQLQQVEQPAEQPEPEPAESAGPQKPTLSLPDYSGVIRGANMPETGLVIYRPADPQTRQMIEGSQTVTPAGGTLPTTYLLQETPEPSKPGLSPADGGVVQGASPVITGDKPWSVAETGVAGALSTFADFTDAVGKNLVITGAASKAAGFELIGGLQQSAGKAIIDPVGAIQGIQSPPDPEKDAAEQTDRIKGIATGMMAVGTVLNQGKEAGIGSPLIGIGKDMISNIGYATEGIKVTVGEDGPRVDNLPSPLMLTFTGTAAAGLGGLLGASGIAAGGIANPLKAFSTPAAIKIEGEAAASVIGGGGTAGGTAVVQATGTKQLAALGALGGIFDGADIVRQENTKGPFYSGSDLIRQENIKGPFYSGSDIVRQESANKELTPGREADETISEYARTQLTRQSEKDAVAAANAVLSAGTAQQTTTRPSYAADYIYGRPEISREEEYAKKNPFAEVTRNPYEFVRVNETANANRFNSAYFYRGEFETGNPQRKIRLPDIDIELPTAKKKKQKKKAKRTDQYYYVTRDLPTAKDLFGSPGKKSGKKKGTDLLTRKKKKQPKLF